MQVDDTIAAVASPPTGGLRAIIRLSGPQTSDVLARCFVGHGAGWRTATRPTDWSGDLDAGPPLGMLPARLLYWPTASSYTRQVSAELHLPGSPPLADAALQILCQHGARLAAPGEFTLRAFLAGRIDLTQAEAVLGVIDARSQQELDVALRQLAGGLAQPLGDLRRRLLEALSHLEAGLDFAEEDIEFISPQQLQATLAAILSQIERLQRQMEDRGQAIEVPRAVLYGRPNSGKSSLFNRLCRDGLAIVSSTSGTTRDYLTARIRLGQLPCDLIDTAGQVELLLGGADQDAQTAAEGQCRAAHLRLLCLDVSRPRDSWELRQLANRDDTQLIVWTKCDLAPDDPESAHGMRTSALSGHGCDPLLAAIETRLQTALAIGPEIIVGTAIRSTQSVRRAAEALSEAAALSARSDVQELVAAELRWALDELGQVAGAVHNEEVLDQIFRRFCIGK